MQMINENVTYYRRALESAIGVPFTDGNSVDVLHNGDAIFSAMLEAIRSAETAIDFVTFVYWKGEIAEQFADALIEKARAGVTVRVLLDAFGSRQITDKVLSKIHESAIELRWFRPLSTWRIWRSDKRTHRKILVCDNTVGFTGGVGIADEWAGNANNRDQWRDSHYQIKGLAIKGLRAAFYDNWNESGDWVFDSSQLEAPKQPRSGNVAIQTVRASTTIAWTDIATLLRTLITIAKGRILISTAYLSPDDVLVEMLCDAAKKGIRVTILTAGDQTDSRLSQLAGQLYYSQLLASGAEIYRYQKTLLHSKLLLVDDQVSCIGSANINHRSLSKDEECCLVALSQELNFQSATQLERDLNDAEKLVLKDWQQRGIKERTQERLARIIVEQL